MQNYNFQKALMIGLGLIGGSFAMALRQKQLVHQIFAFDIDYASIEAAKKIFLIDGYCLPEEELKNFDLVVLAVNLESYQKILPKLFKNCSPDAAIIDLGSIKNFSFFDNIPKNFVACHPIAGSEKSGFANANAELFTGKKFIICPEKSDKIHIDRIFNIAKKIGAIPEFIDAKLHDHIYSLTSHLPQFLSFCCKEFTPQGIENHQFGNAFRLDNSSPEMWQDIFAFNEKNIQFFYEIFFAHLEDLIEDLSNLNLVALREIVANLEFIKLDNEFSLCDKDLMFLEKNFAAISFRFFIALAFVKITELKTHHNYAGSGFKDFISILSLLNCRCDFDLMIKKNLTQIRSFFNKIS